jgi:hypothetical protein
MDSVLSPHPVRAAAPQGRRSTQPGESSRTAWRALGGLGWVLLAASLSDLGLTWYPLEIGRPEWEFGTIAASYSGVPLLAMALAIIMSSGFALGRRGIVRLSAGVMIVLGLLMVAGTVLFLLDVPLALRLSPPEVLLGIKKTIAKTIVLGAVFPLFFLIAGIVALRASSTRGPHS